MRNQFDHILIPENGAELRTKLWWHCWQDSQLPLPAKGFLAGGAVASLILSEVWGGNFPINDLDVFLTDDNKIIPPATPVRTTEIALDENADDNGYSGWYIQSKNCQKITFRFFLVS